MHAERIGTRTRHRSHDFSYPFSEGKLADFVILSQDPREADPEGIKEIPIVRTVLGGKTVYRI